MSSPEFCSHLYAIREVIKSETNVCEDCIKEHTKWVHLRICQECGVTLCCDDSPRQHMRKHHNATGHPAIASAQPGERWLYCYIDDEMVEY